MAIRELGIGFSFAGRHCNDMNCSLGNNDPEMHAFVDNFTSSSENVDGYDGEYPTGNVVKGREFEVKLTVEYATDEDLVKIGNWLAKGKSGSLIWDHRPYKYYTVQVSSPVAPSLYVHYDSSKQLLMYSGTITVKFKAYIPYAYLLDEVKDQYPTVGTMKATLDAGTGVLASSMNPAVTGTTAGTKLLLNAGNALARPEIWITGKFPTGLVIMNNTTGQETTIKTTSNNVETYCVDSLMGRTIRWVGADHPLTEAIRKNNILNATKYMADDVKYGNFINLAPCFPVWRNVSYSVSGTTVTLSGGTDVDMVGCYIYIAGEWRKIMSITDATHLMIGTSLGSSSGTAQIMRLNEVVITKPNVDTLNKISFCYRSTFY